MTALARPLLFAAAIVVMAASFGRSEDVPVSRTEEIRKVSEYLSGKKAGRSAYGLRFSLEWQIKPYDGRKVGAWVGGASFDSPRYVVDYLRLYVDGAPVRIPRDAYVDIYDPNPYDGGPDILQDSQFLYIVVMASDGAGSAKITLKFSRGKYVGRRIED